jgi:hypothetical protein
MHAIYASPFVLLSVVSCLVCLVVPRFRGYALQALAIPVGFGFFAILGGVTFVLFAHEVLKWTPPIDGIPGVLMLAVIYFVSGLCGAWLANLAAKSVGRWLRL